LEVSNDNSSNKEEDMMKQGREDMQGAYQTIRASNAVAKGR
jgi:hypothetical protein